MAHKKSLRKVSTDKKFSVRDMLSPNMRITAFLIAAVILLVTVSTVSIFSRNGSAADNVNDKTVAVRTGDGNVAEGGVQSSGGALQAPSDKDESNENTQSTPVDNNTNNDANASDETGTDVSESDEIKKAHVTAGMVPFDGVLQYDDDHQAVAKIQERLMALSYMDNDEVTEHFGPITRDAISCFQRRNGLEITGKVDAETYEILMSEDALIYMMSLGDDGDDVSIVQDRLYEMGYLGIKPTGYFGEDTEKAVKAFQTRNSITVDGKVGTETKNLIFSENAAPNVWEKGDSSDSLIPYQKRLIKLGYLTTEADGEYGSATKAAVKRFQDRNGLHADGYLGPKTIDTLMSSDAISNAYILGDDCNAVEKIQKRLYSLGYVRKSSITGYFGSATEYAVKAFQKRNGLSADGRVGTKTLSAINSSSAKKALSGYKFYGESGSSSSSGGSNSSSTPTPSSSPSISKLIEAAKSRLGCRYVTGGKGPDKFDCSGLVWWCLKQAGVNQSYMTSYGWRSVSRYQRISSINNLRAGDIIVFYGHVGIIVSSSEMIDASSSNGKVVRRSFKGSWSRRNFICGYRIFD